MGRLVRAALLSTAVWATMGWAAHASLIFTEDFENPVNSRGWQVYPTFGLDWTSSPSTAGIEIQTSGTVSGVAAHSGNQYVELDSDTQRGGRPGRPSNSNMTRLLTLSAGTYTLEWYYLPRTGKQGDNRIEVFLDGASQTLGDNLIAVQDGTRPPQTDWMQIITQFTVSEPLDNDYALTFAAGGLQNELGGFIDSVTLRRDVPVPASLGLLGLGLAGFGVARRFRRG